MSNWDEAYLPICHDHCAWVVEPLLLRRSMFRWWLFFKITIMLLRRSLGFSSPLKIIITYQSISVHGSVIPLSNPLVKISIPPLSHPSLHTYVLKVPKRRGGVDYIAHCKLRTAKTFALKLAINRSSGILTPLIPENAYVLCTLLLPASPALLALQSDANCLKKRSQLEWFAW